MLLLIFEVLSRRLPAWNDGPQSDHVSLDVKGHEVHVLVDDHERDGLVRILVSIGVRACFPNIAAAREVDLVDKAGDSNRTTAGGSCAGECPPVTAAYSFVGFSAARSRPISCSIVSRRARIRSSFEEMSAASSAS